ncbi:hypothetical protein CD798_08290 [Bacillaceae bacterium SAOS 7]|nr:hypothetical protein CD798_08290 [Bacillaceae bacterium SAOS 7]
MKKHWMFGSALLSLGLILSACGDEKTDSAEPKQEVPEEKPTSQDETKTQESNSSKTDASTSKPQETEENDWKEKVKGVASSDKTKTEKFDEISLYAMSYTPNESELSEFENYIINEFKAGNYLNDIENDEYMLTNILKAQVIESHYKDANGNPAGEFAFDFLQNTKYTYRGVDTVDSQSVLANEEQMNKSLEKISLK